MDKPIIDTSTVRVVPSDVPAGPSGYTAAEVEFLRVNPGATFGLCGIPAARERGGSLLAAAVPLPLQTAKERKRARKAGRSEWAHIMGNLPDGAAVTGRQRSGGSRSVKFTLKRRKGRIVE